MERTLHIGRVVIEAIAAHARDDAPLECCGLLVGIDDRIEHAVRADNLDRSPRRYTLDPRAYLQAAREARERGRDVLGAYHSHPVSAAIPSDTDLAEGADAPFIYLIAGPVVAGGSSPLRAWQKDEGRFSEVRLIIDG